MMRGLKNRLMKQKLETLKKCFSEEIDFTQDVISHFQGKPKYIVFLSARDAQERTTVVHAVANSFEASWRNAVQLLRKSIALRNIEVTSWKADVVTSIQAYEVNDFLTALKERGTEDLYEGIAFDPMFNSAFLAEEANEHSFVQGFEDETPHFVMDRLNAYRKAYQLARYSLKEEHIQNVYAFETKAFSIDAASDEPVEVESSTTTTQNQHYLLINELYDIPSLKKNVMPLHSIESKEQIAHYMSQYPAATIQQKGGILQLIFKQDEEHYISVEEEEIYSIPTEHLMESLPSVVPSMYVQQYVQSITELGLQYKLIVRLSKQEQQWQHVENFVAMNIEGHVSFDQEGAVATIETEPFIERHYPNKASSTLATVETFIETIIRYLNSRPALNADELDIMIGIDVEGTPWIERVIG